MLHVLFILLKILGILLLLLVGVLLLVLLAPLRYSFKLEKEEQVSPEFSVRVTWLCWLFYFKASYIEKAFDYRIRILGHQIAGNQKEFLERQRKRQKKRRKNVEKKREQEGGITEERKRTACYNIGRESLCNRKTGRRSPERKRVRRKLQWGERKGCGFQ